MGLKVSTGTQFLQMRKPGEMAGGISFIFGVEVVLAIATRYGNFTPIGVRGGVNGVQYFGPNAFQVENSSYTVSPASFAYEDNRH